MVIHGVVVAAVVSASFLVSTSQLPDVPGMMAFVVAAAPAPPPPPPPPPPARRAAPAKPQALSTASRSAAPIEAPAAIIAERFIPSDEEEGVEGGIEGGIPGGVVGGVVGGLLGAPAPPPPASPPVPTRPTPVRIGGQLTAPELTFRVNPTYPEMAVHAKITGTVILEATVGGDGSVESVRVLRSVSLLDKAAIEAVKQWRYSPLLINGIPTPFILSVTLQFSLKG
jgi:protein TonB